MPCLLNSKFFFYLLRSQRENWHHPRGWGYLSDPLKYQWTKFHLPFCAAGGVNDSESRLLCDRCTAQHLQTLWLGQSRFFQSPRPHCSGLRSRWYRLLQVCHTWGPPFLQEHQDTNPILQHKLESTGIGELDCVFCITWASKWLKHNLANNSKCLLKMTSGYQASLGFKIVKERSWV